MAVCVCLSTSVCVCLSMSVCVQSVCVLLCCVFSQDSALPVVAEALDAIMDVFAEDHTDPLLEQLAVLHKLTQLMPTLKSKVRLHNLTQPHFRPKSESPQSLTPTIKAANI